MLMRNRMPRELRSPQVGQLQRGRVFLRCGLLREKLLVEGANPSDCVVLLEFQIQLLAGEGVAGFGRANEVAPFDHPQIVGGGRQQRDPVLLGIFAGLIAAIPLVGPSLGIMPPLLLGLTLGPAHAVLVVVLLIVQLVDAAHVARPGDACVAAGAIDLPARILSARVAG